MMEFAFETSARLLFGRGTSSQVAALALEYGRRIFLVTGRMADRSGIAASFRSLDVAIERFCVAGEPTVASVVEGVARARASGASVVVAVGGGSVLDAGKAVSALASNRGEILDYLEVVGQGRPLAVPGLPCIAVPTTAGTGSEVTRNAVLGVPERAVKVSLRHAYLLPRVALIDPDLTVSCPENVTVWSGLDAITQVMEAFVSKRRNPLVDGICREALRRAGPAFSRVCRDGADVQARQEMAFVSLAGGLALANAGLGAVHGLAGPLGGMTEGPHGALCARLVGPVMAANIAQIERQGDPEGLLTRYDEMGRLFSGAPNTDRRDLLTWLGEAVETGGVPGLAKWGLQVDRFAEAVAKAAQAGSMKGNPVVLPPERMERILEEAF